MNAITEAIGQQNDQLEAQEIFQREIGASNVDVHITSAGGQDFLKFVVGREAPFFLNAVRETENRLPEDNAYRGTLGLWIRRTEAFPESLEAASLLTLLTRSTRPVAEHVSRRAYSVPYVPFQNREDYQLAQPASHVVVGRRGVGKSTLIRRSVEILRSSPALIAVLDSQVYSTLTGEDLLREIMYDVVRKLEEDAKQVAQRLRISVDTAGLSSIANDLISSRTPPKLAVPRLKRALLALTHVTHGEVYVFLDDFHLVSSEEQPRVIHLIHGSLKGVNGWLKVAGLRSLLNHYSSSTKEGLQVPGDAQRISLDLTLEDPEAAEGHLRRILEKFLQAVGYETMEDVLPQKAFRRLVWANAGVPRDFLQMFARALEHARRNRHALVTLSDVNIAIGEFGQDKLRELNEDARNTEDLRKMLGGIERFCLEEKEINAFLVKSEESQERALVQTLSDLRLVHLINQSITPDRAGQRYEAFLLDYSMFTGFRRRQRIKELFPEQGQFKASELRKLPKISAGFLEVTSERA